MIIRRIAGRSAFTLLEVLVVVGIIALLVAILLPSLVQSRAQAASVRCRANLRQIGLGLVMYSQQNRDYAIPSYNLPFAPGATTNTTGSPDQKFDGWGPILDRDRFVNADARDSRTVFYCPRTVDVEGMKDGQTGYDPDKPRGWTDWPLRFLATGGDSSPKEPTTIPERGFKKIIRVSYWLNAYNPVGNSVPDLDEVDLFYTASVGFGPDGKGKFIRPKKMNLFRPSPSLFLIASDGIYMGRQQVTQQGNQHSRIGYRHPGRTKGIGSANIILADGHVEAMQGDRFPRAVVADDSPEVIAAKRHENLSGPTIYANPRKIFPQ
jgi:prepilin-type N-terminal cleavage/methylation domain-containing protein/prepilin-type processing-associated H-X9-DG protein